MFTNLERFIISVGGGIPYRYSQKTLDFGNISIWYQDKAIYHLPEAIKLWWDNLIKRITDKKLKDSMLGESLGLGFNTLRPSGMFNGFFDYSQGKWVNNMREVEERCKREGKVFASDAEIAQEASKNRKAIQDAQKADAMAQGKEIVRKNFKKWRKEFNPKRAEATYKELVDANHKLANAKIDDTGNPIL